MSARILNTKRKFFTLDLDNAKEVYDKVIARTESYLRSWVKLI